MGRGTPAAGTGIGNIGRSLIRATTVALVLVVLLPAGSAAAETLAISSPLNAGATLGTTPPFNGTTNGTTNSVILVIHEGPSIAGPQVAEGSIAPAEGLWNITLLAPLAPGTYTAIATEPAELGETSTSTAVTFTIETAPVVSADPAHQAVNAGEEATFTAAASGVPAPTVRWEVSTDGGAHWSEDVGDSGATTGTLHISATKASENGNEYRAAFTNAAGSADSEAASLEVRTAPVVSSNPSGVIVKAGEEASFTAVASGFPTPTVQWEVSTDGGAHWSHDVGDSGATTGTLTISATKASENGNKYRAVFTNTAGSVDSEAASLEVRTAPVVSSNPTAKAVNAGASASFTAAASGFPTPTVQWQVSTNGGGSWSTDVSDSGATTGTLTVSATKASENGNEYRAVFTNTAGSADSEAASLEVRTAPVVMSSPVGKTVKAGEEATFTAAASGFPTPTVQWQVSTNGGSTWSTDVSDLGATTGTLQISATKASENGNEYRALFTNTAGTAPSTPASLEVQTAPVVTKAPSNRGVIAGESAVFTAAASGVPTPTVQWQVSSNFGETWEDDHSDAGNTTGKLTVASTVALDGHEYRAVFKNVVEEVPSSAATLTVSEKKIAPEVTSSPTDRTVTAGQPAVFTAAASGVPTPSIQWEVSKDAGAHWAEDTTDPGHATGTLVIEATTLAESGYQYRAMFKNTAGTSPSSAATLTIQTVPSISHQPANVSVTAGKPAAFTAAATGTPTPTVQWQVSTDSGVTWSNDVTDSGATTGTLTLPPTKASENGNEYRAVFTNAAGSAESSPAKLEVRSAPVVTGSPTSRAVKAGEPVVFTATAAGAPTPSVQWEVFKSGGTEWEKDTADPGNKTGTLVVEPTTIAESGYQYRAVFKNPAGTTPSAPATLTVGTLTVTSNPASTSVTAGETATFTAAAEGTPPPEVAWQESSDGGATWVTLPGANTDTLTIEHAPLADNGREYRAVFTNGIGSGATTQAATLTVTAPPTVVAPSPPVGPTSPVASFSWFPAAPRAGEPVSLASTSTDAASPITGYAWDPTGNGSLMDGGAVLTTTFATPGNHAVRLRVTDAAGRSSEVAETIVVSAQRLPLMQPFPIVRIAGTDNAFGARLSLLSVLAPSGARITVTCRGRGCPTRPEVRTAASREGREGPVQLAFKRFERTLRAGVTLEIRVWKAGQIGKYTSFRIRRSQLPLRVDMCLDPTTSRPIVCPSS